MYNSVLQAHQHVVDGLCIFWSTFCVVFLVQQVRLSLRGERRYGAVNEHLRVFRQLRREMGRYPVGSSDRYAVWSALMAIDIREATGEPVPRDDAS